MDLNNLFTVLDLLIVVSPKMAKLAVKFASLKGIWSKTGVFLSLKRLAIDFCYWSARSGHRYTS